MLQGGGSASEESLCVLAASLDGNGACVWVHACVCGICKPHLPHLRSAMGIPPKRVYACGWLFCVCLEWPPLLLRRGDDGYAKLRSLETDARTQQKHTHADTPRSAIAAPQLTHTHTRRIRAHMHILLDIYAHTHESADANTHPHQAEPKEAVLWLVIQTPLSLASASGCYLAPFACPFVCSAFQLAVSVWEYARPPQPTLRFL